MLFDLKPVRRENGAPTWKEELKRRREEFGGILGRGLSFRIVVPPDMMWWYWNEFGTAAFAEKGTSNPGGYQIEPVDAKLLVFPGKNGETQMRMSVWMYGISPKHMVTTVVAEIQDICKASLVMALIQSGFDREAFKKLIVDYMMPNIKEIIRDSFEQNLDKYYSGGRPTHTPNAHTLGGIPAWKEFEDKAQIVTID